MRMWRKDIHNVLAFKVEAALTECVLNILVFMQAYLRTSQINLNNLHVFTGEWSSVLLNNNWVWFDFSRYCFAQKICYSSVPKTQILLSSWHCSDCNTGKGLFAVLLLVGIITLKQNFLSGFLYNLIPKWFISEHFGADAKASRINVKICVRKILFIESDLKYLSTV